ncbi:MAG: transglycosylase domain-containing protein [Candidatus Azambacteria bacterium]|nr:transglycosylase domain-containing protein [Candidatus Azambacteria bacterium]
MERKRKWINLLVILCCFTIIFVSTGYLVFWYYFDYKVDDLPDVFVLKDYKFNLTTTVRDDGGEIIDKFKVEDRVYIPFRSVPAAVIKAVISAEDKDFFSERLIYGIDSVGIVRAAFKNVVAGKIIAGGSTISQQTAKLIWLNNEKTFKRKFKEARLAYRMEKYLSDELIFEIYINLVYFGHGKYGIVSASEFYFSKQPSELTTGEAAMLAGLIKWPYQFSPIVNKKIAISQRNMILSRMMNNGFISYDEYSKFTAKSVALNVKNVDPKAPYLSNFFMDELHRLGYGKVVNQGLDVKTSINSFFQLIANRALIKGLEAYDKRHEKRLVLYNIFSEYKLESIEDFKSESWGGELGIESIVDGLVIEVDSSFVILKIGNETASITAKSFPNIRNDIIDLKRVFKVGDVIMIKITSVNANNDFIVEVVQPEVQGAVVIVEVATGAIKAIVGGRDFKVNKYNRAMQADRQPGSAFKPFVYGAYFEKHPDKNLESHVLDTPICFKTGNSKKPKWCPKNYEEKSLPPFMGSIPIKTAIARSRNVAAVHVAKEVGINNVVDLARSIGIASDLPRYLPTAIGAADVKVIDMAIAYSTFFRQGIFKPYWFINSITDRNGLTKNLETKEEKQALSAESANKVLGAMRWVVLAGTARSASKELPFATAGKTGTTNNFTDAWFVGGSPRYVVAVWIGFDRKAIPLVSRENYYKETGGSVALPIFIEIMKEIYKIRPPDLFPEEIESGILGKNENK